MRTCPNGHQSAADDWCEVCGHRMAPAPGAGRHSPPPPSGGYGYPAPPGPTAPIPDDATAQAELCPRCRTPREERAQFCEECRHDFRTGAPGSFPPPHGGQGAAPLEYTNSGRTHLNRPAEPIPPQPATGDADWQLAPPGAPAHPQGPHQGRPYGATPEQSYPPAHGQPYPPQGGYPGGPAPYPGGASYGGPAGVHRLPPHQWHAARGAAAGGGDRHYGVDLLGALGEVPV
ncbi:hypothetical protein H3146_25835, partial [Streptomyces sp. OF3]|nr:hypothetical protein [Streptomyces alkaliterrae]